MNQDLDTKAAARGRVDELGELARQLGRELPLTRYHGLLKRTALALGRDAQFGTCLITCSDEFQGDLRRSFEHDVAHPLVEAAFGNDQRSFELSNLGSRVEPGAMALVADHFAQPETAGEELFVVHVSAHLGRRRDGDELEYGTTQRFGLRSTCCGALNAALKPAAERETVALPWLEQLRGAFGSRRLEELRRLAADARPIQQAVTHAVLQCEAALCDLFRQPPAERHTLLLVSTITVNQPGEDGILPVAHHLLRFDGGRVEVLDGGSLQASPVARHLELADDLVTVAVDGSPDTQRAALAEPLHTSGTGELESLVAELRDQVLALGADPTTWRMYARPLLRAYFQRLTALEPRLGLRALRAESGVEWLSPEELAALDAADEPSLCAGLRDAETRVQTLRHQDAQRVLDRLSAQDTPLFGV